MRGEKRGMRGGVRIRAKRWDSLCWPGECRCNQEKRRRENKEITENTGSGLEYLQNTQI